MGLSERTPQNRDKLKEAGILKEQGEAGFMVDDKMVSTLSNMLENKSLEEREKLKAEGKLRERDEKDPGKLDGDGMEAMTKMLSTKSLKKREELKEKGIIQDR